MLGSRSVSDVQGARQLGGGEVEEEVVEVESKAAVAVHLRFAKTRGTEVISHF